MFQDDLAKLDKRREDNDNDFYLAVLVIVILLIGSSIDGCERKPCGEDRTANKICFVSVA